MKNLKKASLAKKKKHPMFPPTMMMNRECPKKKRGRYNKRRIRKSAETAKKEAKKGNSNETIGSQTLYLTPRKERP
jgi:hypothetical protein